MNMYHNENKYEKKMVCFKRQTDSLKEICQKCLTKENVQSVDKTATSKGEV